MEQRTKQDYINLLEETVAYYTEDESRYSVGTKGGCFYYKYGKYCAVGRCLKKSVSHTLDSRMESLGVDDTVYNVNLAYGGNIPFLNKYKGFSIEFWCELQYLHDTQSFHDESMVNNIRRWIDINV